MENVENKKEVTGQVSHTVNIHHEEYLDVIRAFIKMVYKDQADKLSADEIQALVHSYIEYFISGVTTDIYYKDGSFENFVFLNFHSKSATVKASTIAYCVKKDKKTKEFQFIN
jgi:hypothetical protein